MTLRAPCKLYNTKCMEDAARRVGFRQLHWLWNGSRLEEFIFPSIDLSVWPELPLLHLSIIQRWLLLVCVVVFVVLFFFAFLPIRLIGLNDSLGIIWHTSVIGAKQNSEFTWVCYIISHHYYYHQWWLLINSVKPEIIFCALLKNLSGSLTYIPVFKQRLFKVVTL